MAVSWPNMNVVMVSEEDYEAVDLPVEAIEAVAPPQVPPPVWDARPVDPEQAMAAVRAMCGGVA